MTEQITVPRSTWDAMREKLVTDAMIDAYLTEQRRTVEEADRFGRPNIGGLHTNTVREACRNGIRAALAAANAVSAPKACDMGVTCLDCQPRGKNGECPDQQPQVQGGAYISVSDLRSMRRGNIGSDNTKPSHSLWLGFNQALDAAIDYALHYPAHPQATEPNDFSHGYDIGYEAGKLHASQATEPEGWKLVPIRPTVEMLDAANASDREYSLRAFGAGVHMCQSGEDHWAAMLAAAPEAP